MKNVITCVIVDDDSFAIKVICDHIEKLPRLKVLKIYQSSLDALAGINALGADLVFLDIDMPGLSGLSLASAIRHSTPNIIFTTAFTEYALKAFDLRAKHYLLKPIEFVRFAQEVNTVIKECFDNPLDEDSQAFYVRNGERGNRVKVLKGDIIYFQGAGNYLHIFTPTEHYTIYYALKDMEKKLSQNLNFYRVHKSYIINTDFIRSIQGNTIHLQKYDVLMTAPFKEDFIRYLEDNTLLFKKD